MQSMKQCPKCFLTITQIFGLVSLQANLNSVMFPARNPPLCTTVLHFFFTTHGASRIGDFEVQRWR